MFVTFRIWIFVCGCVQMYSCAKEPVNLQVMWPVNCQIRMKKIVLVVFHFWGPAQPAWLLCTAAHNVIPLACTNAWLHESTFIGFYKPPTTLHTGMSPTHLLCVLVPLCCRWSFACMAVSAFHKINIVRKQDCYLCRGARTYRDHLSGVGDPSLRSSFRPCLYQFCWQLIPVWRFKNQWSDTR